MLKCQGVAAVGRNFNVVRNGKTARFAGGCQTVKVVPGAVSVELFRWPKCAWKREELEMQRRSCSRSKRTRPPTRSFTKYASRRQTKGEKRLVPLLLKPPCLRRGCGAGLSGRRDAIALARGPAIHRFDCHSDRDRRHLNILG